jgi:hypothetical protein
MSSVVGPPHTSHGSGGPINRASYCDPYWYQRGVTIFGFRLYTRTAPRFVPP